MNKENAHLYLPFVQALVDGKQLQFKNSDHNSEWWEDFKDEIEFYMYDCPSDYRIKPEPRTWSFWIDPEGNLWHYHITPVADWKRIEVQEVLE